MALENFKTSVRNAAATAYITQTESGVPTVAAAYIEVLTAGDLLLGTLVMSQPGFLLPVADGIGTADAITPGIAVASGDAAKFKQYNWAEEVLWEGSVGATGSGEDMEMPDVAVVAGEPISVSTYTVTVPASA